MILGVIDISRKNNLKNDRFEIYLNKLGMCRKEEILSNIRNKSKDVAGLNLFKQCDDGGYIMFENWLDDYDALAKFVNEKINWRKEFKIRRISYGK